MGIDGEYDGRDSGGSRKEQNPHPEALRRAPKTWYAPYGFLINRSGLSNGTFLTLGMLYGETYAFELTVHRRAQPNEMGLNMVLPWPLECLGSGS